MFPFPQTEDQSGAPFYYSLDIDESERVRLLDAIRRHPQSDNVKKALVELLETPPRFEGLRPRVGNFDWGALEREAARRGHGWTVADVLSEGRKLA